MVEGRYELKVGVAANVSFPSGKEWEQVNGRNTPKCSVFNDDKAQGERQTNTSLRPETAAECQAITMSGMRDLSVRRWLSHQLNQGL